MRILFTSLPGLGHFHPLVPLAQALRQAGHEVAFALGDPFRHMVERCGFAFFRAGEDMENSARVVSQEERARLMEQMRANPALFFESVLRNLIERVASRLLPDLRPIVSAWRPRIVVRDMLEFAGCVAAEAAGIPHASIHVTGLRPDEFPNDALVTRLNALRAMASLPPDPDLEMPFRHLHLALMPPRFFNGSMPGTTRYLAPAVFDQSGGEALPAWTAQLGERPVVYVTLGTVANRMIHILRALVEALRDEPLELVVTVGRDMDPAQLGPQPAHVHVERYIPQSLILPRCALAVMHGGYNSTFSALLAGRPLVLVPLGSDQPVNARRCRELGAAEVLDAAALSPGLIRERVRKVLDDPRYREAARLFQEESRALPGLEHGVALIEQLAAAGGAAATSRASARRG